MQNPTSLQILADLARLVVKFAGRPAVQRQLYAVGLILVVAWAAGRLLDAWLSRRFPEESPSPDQEEPPIEAGKETGEASDPISMPHHRSYAANLLLTLIRELDFPLFSLGLAYLVVLLFAGRGWPSGLIEGSIAVLWLFQGYRSLLALLYATIRKPRVDYYRARLLRPLFVIVLLAMVLAMLTQLSSLAQAPLFAGERQNGLTLGTLFLVVAGFYFWIVFTQALQEGLQALINRRNRYESGAVQASLILGRYALIIAGLYGVFRALRLSATTIAAISGGLSIGLGFALQDVVKNFLGGIILLFEGSLRPGDWVEVAGVEGEVERFNIRATIIRRLDNVRIIVPNQEWLTSKVTTYTYGNRQSLVTVKVGVSYESDLEQVRKLMIETVKRHPKVLQDPAPFAALVNFGNSTLDLVAGGWVAEPRLRAGVMGDLRLMILDAFKEHGVEMPPPQQEIFVHTDASDTPPAESPQV
jgi:potassium efflux system protein